MIISGIVRCHFSDQTPKNVQADKGVGFSWGTKCFVLYTKTSNVLDKSGHILQVKFEKVEIRFEDLHRIVVGHGCLVIRLKQSGGMFSGHKITEKWGEILELRTVIVLLKNSCPLRSILLHL